MPIERCVDCGKELGFLSRYAPKITWSVKGEFCRECYIKRIENEKQNKNQPVLSLQKCEVCGKEIVGAQTSGIIQITLSKEFHEHYEKEHPKEFQSEDLLRLSIETLSRMGETQMRSGINLLFGLPTPLTIISQSETNELQRTFIDLVKQAYLINPKHIEPKIIRWINLCKQHRGTQTIITSLSMALASAQNETKIKKEESSNDEMLNPLKVLQLRYIKGEITEKQYEEMKKVLQS